MSQLLQPQVLDRLALAASALLVILLGHALAGLTWSALPQSQQAAPPPPAVERAAGGQRSSGPNLQQLAQLHLFGQAQADDIPRAAPIDAPDTRLNLTLRGILFNPEAEQARAIIAAPGRSDEHYRVGQQVSAGVTIDRILADRVILLREGQYETLRLPEDGLELAAAEPRQSGRPQGRPTAAQTGQGGADAATLNQYREQLLARPDEAGRFLRAEPVTGNGGLQGFRVSPGADGRLFEIAGLQDGDIVTSVNGVELNQFDKGFEAMEQLASAQQLTLTVLRGGQRQTIQLQLQH